MISKCPQCDGVGVDTTHLKRSSSLTTRVCMFCNGTKVIVNNSDEIVRPVVDHTKVDELNDIAKKAYKNSSGKGWWDGARSAPELLCLVHSEVSEALEDYRNNKIETYEDDNGKPCGFNSELADIIIRVLDMSAHYGIDIQGEVERKMKFNETRSYRHGDKRC